MTDGRYLRESTESRRARGTGGQGLRLAHKAATPAGLPFVTISRQVGAGAVALGEQLVEQLNRERRQKTDPPWELYDQRLVEQVAQEHQLPREWVDLLEDRDFSWLSELFAGLDFRTQGELNEFTIYRRVSETIRRLARRGHVVIVGRGGAYITADLPQGVHVRLVAPRDDRISFLARRLNIDREAAAEEVQRRESNREAFYHRYWPARTLNPDNFTTTINTWSLNEATMVRMLSPLIESRAHAPAASRS